MHAGPALLSSFIPHSSSFFGQQFAWSDLLIVGLLTLLEGLLSLDNAMVLGVLASRVPRSQRSRVLLYGLAGAFVFRLIAIALAAYLLRWSFLKLIGGLYLLWVVARHLLAGRSNSSSAPSAPIPAIPPRKFWSAVLAIELTDLAFAADSILAAIALIGPLPPGYPPNAIHPRLWIVVVGGFLGVVLMRFAAVFFIRLMEKFPRLETSAYLIVAVIAMKMLADWYLGEVPRVLGWVFWLILIACFLSGFLPSTDSEGPASG